MTEITASSIVDRLRARYAADKGWATVAEVRNRLGWRSDRSIDFLAVQTWDSGAPFYLAVEIKVARGDWARELANPAKRREWEDSMTEFWFAAPRGVIPVEELPEGAGLLETAGQGLRATRKAQQYRDHEPTPQIWTNVLRRLVERMVDRENPNRHFAEFAGRPVSIDDLRRLAEKLKPVDTHLFRERVWDATEEARSRTIKWQAKEGPILNAARGLAHAAKGEREFVRHDEIARIVNQVAAEYDAKTDRVRMAKELREAAEILDPRRVLGWDLASRDAEGNLIESSTVVHDLEGNRHGSTVAHAEDDNPFEVSPNVTAPA